MWNEYFHGNIQIFGFDINPNFQTILKGNAKHNVYEFISYPKNTIDIDDDVLTNVYIFCRLRVNTPEPVGFVRSVNKLLPEI